MELSETTNPVPDPPKEFTLVLSENEARLLMEIVKSAPHNSPNPCFYCEFMSHFMEHSIYGLEQPTLGGSGSGPILRNC